MKRHWSDIKQGKMSTAQMEQARQHADNIVLKTTPFPDTKELGELTTLELKIRIMNVQRIIAVYEREVCRRKET